MINNFTPLSSNRPTGRTWRSQYSFLPLFYFNVCMASVSFAIILPSIWLYIRENSGTTFFLALVLSVYAGGEVIGSLLFGFLYGRLSTKTGLLLSMMIGLLGSLSYLLGAHMEGVTLWMILVGRLLQGVWTGGEQALEQAYITEEVSETYRLRAINEIGMATMCGYILGPIFGTLCLIIDTQLLVNLDEATAPCYFQVTMGLVVFVATLLRFKENQRDKLQLSPRDNLTAMPDRLGVLYGMATCFFIFNSFTVLETIVAPVFTNSSSDFVQEEWPLIEVYILYSAGALSSILALFVVRKLEFLGDRKLLLGFLLLGAGSWCLCLDFNGISESAFVAGICVLSASISACRNALFSMYSKMIGSEAAGRYMGFLIAFGALARIISPFWAVQSLKISLNVSIVVNASTLAISAGLLLIFWKHCDFHAEHDSDYIRFDFLNKKRASKFKRRMRK